MGHAKCGYAPDALGSVRATLNGTGQPLAVMRYDPWGAPQTSAIAPFGFTGEFQQGSNVYLRARWYNASRGVFTARDPFAGFSEQPYSLHPYQYAYSAPTTWTDPSGWYTNPCAQGQWRCGGGTPSAADADGLFDPESSICSDGYMFDREVYRSSKRWDAHPTGCVSIYDGHKYGEEAHLWDIGFVIGLTLNCSYGAGVGGALEIVFDTSDFEFGSFYTVNANIGAGLSGAVYANIVTGWASYPEDTQSIDNYSGGATMVSGTFGLGMFQGGATPQAENGGQLYVFGAGAALGVQVKTSVPELDRFMDTLFGSAGITFGKAGLISGSKKPFHSPKQDPTIADAQAFEQFVYRFAEHLGPSIVPILDTIKHNGGVYQERQNQK